MKLFTAFLRHTLLLIFVFTISACKGQTTMTPPEQYFTGKQLELAKLVNTADAKAVYEMAKAMPLEELNAYGKEQMTVLLYTAKIASKQNELYSMVTALLKAGADPQQEGQEGEAKSSLLEWAVGGAYQSKRLFLLKAVLEGGVNPNTETKKVEGYEAPLISYVAGQDGLAAIKLLVEYGADVNRVDDRGISALSECIMTLGLDEVIYLLDKGANPKIVDYYGVSFAWLLYDEIRDPVNPKDPRLPKALAIRDRIVKMGVQWPPESPEQLRARVKAEKKKQGIDFKFMPEEGYEAFVPKYVPAPVWKTPPRPGMQ